MIRARENEPASYPPLRRYSDRSRVISLTVEQIERDHIIRVRRMVLILAVSAAVLITNAVFIATPG